VNSRKLFALLMVFALTGSALAAQQNTYLNTEHKAKDVTAVQQHSVFVEIVVEAEADREQIHDFAAVVGLVKKCKQVRNVFDNAVLWFNDQFLFGDKETQQKNETDAGMGFNPNNSSTEDEDVFIPRNGSDARWGGCFIPDGFMHAIGGDDPYATGNARAEVSQNNQTVAKTEQNDTSNQRETRVFGGGLNTNDNIDIVRNLIDLDNGCSGCVFEYQSTFFITDPNGHQWMVDKLVYPGSFQGNLFQENVFSDNCASGDGAVPQSDPRDSYNHQDRCEDTPNNDSKENHCEDGSRYCDDDSGDESAGFTATEPIFTTKIQVDPESPYDSGFADEANWQYSDGTGPRAGMPYPDDPSHENYDLCRQADMLNDPSCAIEYNFMVAVDFEAFDAGPSGSVDEGAAGANASASASETDVRENAVTHGEGGANSTDKARDGNSHPHNPNSTQDSPKHVHDAVNLDLFYYDSAPFFVEANPYWDDYGTPPIVTQDCSAVAQPSPNADAQQEADQESAVESRAPIVCDVTSHSGFHAHDGTQTPRPVE